MNTLDSLRWIIYNNKSIKHVVQGRLQKGQKQLLKNVHEPRGTTIISLYQLTTRPFFIDCSDLSSIIIHLYIPPRSYLSDASYSSGYYPSPAAICPVHQPYYYYQPPPQVSHTPSSSSSSLLQVRRPEKTRRFSSEQIQILEEHFYKVDKYVSKVTIDSLSSRTQLKAAQIRVWFNNKRTREHHR